MNRSVFLIFCLLFFSIPLTHAHKKEKKENQYKFKIIKELPHTMAKDQGLAGTCWSYATTSFIESEIMRMGHDSVDLSEIYFVYFAYQNKAHKFIMRHGIHNFSQGGQAHDVMNVINRYGMMPEEIYSGKMYESDKHIHDELEAILKGILKGVSKVRKKMPLWNQAIEAVLNIYLGKIPDSFKWKGKIITPKEFQKSLGIDPKNYVELTSYQYYPMYEKINLDVPDNWSSDLYYNVPLKDLMNVIDNSIENGYTVCWDGDVSEKGFKHKLGFAVLPTDKALKEETYKCKISPQRLVTTKEREKTFLSQESTDDHLMHLIGKSKDAEGNPYYIIKNSWNTNSNDFQGKLHMSEPYIKEKTIAIMVHKNAIPLIIRKKLGF